VYNPTAFDVLSTPLCVPGDPILYVTEAVDRFDRTTLQWLPRITGSFGAVGIAQSRSDRNKLYVGETVSGSIGVVDRLGGVRSGSLPIPWSGAPENPEYVFDVAVLSGDSKIYFTRYLEGGVLVADPRTGVILKRIGVGGPTWPDSGRSDAFVLSDDDSHLYVAVLDGAPRGVVDIDTRTDRVVRTLSLSLYVPQEIALSPSGNRLFVTTQDRFTNLPSQNVLVDVPTWRVLTEFPRPRAGTLRYDGGVAFHPNGKLIFVGRDSFIDIYLSRE
jgi:DNA-binding beta-propeller fold protein YncE